MSASDEPACGSDRHIVPWNRPSTIGRTYASTCSSEPWASSRLALPTVSIAYDQVPMFAAWNHAKQAVWTTCGSCRPPDALVHAAADQPGLGDGVERGLHLGGQAHAAVDELGLGGVGELVVRREPLGGDLRAQVEHGVEGLAGVLGVALALGEGRRRRASRRAGTRGRGARAAVQRPRWTAFPGPSFRKDATAAGQVGGGEQRAGDGGHGVVGGAHAVADGGGDQPFGRRVRDGGPRRHLPRVRPGGLGEALVGQHPVHHVPPLQHRGRVALAGEDQLPGPGRARALGEPLRAAHRRRQPDHDLHQPERRASRRRAGCRRPGRSRTTR